MEGVYYELDTESQFWAELDEILSPVGSPPTSISAETAVPNFVRFAAAFRSTSSPPYSGLPHETKLVQNNFYRRMKTWSFAVLNFFDPSSSFGIRTKYGTNWSPLPMRCVYLLFRYSTIMGLC
jgi:hypothetical protein